MNKIQKGFLGASIVIASVLGFAGVAAAEPPTPTEQVTSMAESAATDLVPIVLGVAGALVTVAAIMFGARFVLRAIRNGGRA